MRKGSIANVMSGNTKAHQDKLAAAALHAIEVEEWLRDKTSKWARIVPNSERGRRAMREARDKVEACHGVR